jgi:hypothetical protein
MRKNIEPAARCIKFIERVSIEVIQLFTEKPSRGKEPKGEVTEDRVHSAELFSSFTTGKTKEKVLVTA